MAAEPAVWVGKTLSGRVRVLAQLGEGGMGYVFLAEDAASGGRVVVKAPKPQMLAGPEFVARFRREITALQRLAHPHVVKILGMGEEEDVPYAVLEYLAGGSLSARQPKGPDGRPRPVAPRRLGEWLPAVAGALDFVHQQNYLHRDVKPDNILFDAAGRACPGDFGAGKVIYDRRPSAPPTVQTQP